MAVLENLLRDNVDNRSRLTELEAQERGLGDVASAYARLPGRRGVWAMSAYDENAYAIDETGNGRTLTYNGNPVYGYDGLAPYIAFDGSGDYLSRADENGLRIAGSESYVGNPGLTMLGWFNPATTAGSQSLMSKWTGYLVQIDTADTIRFATYDGATVDVTPNVAIYAGIWNFIAARFIPSTEIKIWCFNPTNPNGVTGTNTTSIPAALSHTTSEFAIGRLSGGTQEYTGKASWCALCAAAASDAHIAHVFEQSRMMYGV